MYMYIYLYTQIYVYKLLHTTIFIAFADAIEQNATLTPQLEEALRELFTETDQHVPFCALAASTDFTMMSRVSADMNEFNARLGQQVRWDQVPIAHGESFRLEAELPGARDARLLNDLVWDPYEQVFSSYAGDATSTLMEGALCVYTYMYTYIYIYIFVYI